MAKQSDFPFLKICAPKNMIGYHEAAKVQAIKKVSCLDSFKCTFCTQIPSRSYDKQQVNMGPLCFRYMKFGIVSNFPVSGS